MLVSYPGCGMFCREVRVRSPLERWAFKFCDLSAAPVVPHLTTPVALALGWHSDCVTSVINSVLLQHFLTNSILAPRYGYGHMAPCQSSTPWWAIFPHEINLLMVFTRLCLNTKFEHFYFEAWRLIHCAIFWVQWQNFFSRDSMRFFLKKSTVLKVPYYNSNVLGGLKTAAFLYDSWWDCYIISQVTRYITLWTG